MAEGSSRKKLWALLILPLCMLIPLIGVVKVHNRQAALHEKGATAWATVVGSDGRGDTDYLRVRIQGCCLVSVATSNVAAHPVGSVIEVRFDPRNPGNAEALVDRPSPYDPFVVPLVGFGLAVVISVPIVVWAFRREGRARRLVRDGAPSSRVRVEAWRRSYLGNTLPYLSAYPVDAPAGAEPLFCLALAEDAFGKVEAAGGVEYDAFGPPGDGAKVVALRRGELVLTGSAKDAAWEREHRDPQSSVLIDTRPEEARTTPVDGLPIFGDAAEARRYRRVQRAMRALFVLFPLLLIVRMLPDDLLIAALPVLLAFLVFMAGTFAWSRAQLNRLTHRLPPPAPRNRRERKAARQAVSARVNSPAGQAEMATLLGTTPEALKASARTTVRLVVAGFVLAGLVFVASVVRFAFA